jgi:hypothetical protein
VEAPVSAATVNRKLSALASFYEFHHRHGVAPGELLTRWRPGRRGGSWQPFLAHLGVRDRFLLSLLKDTGLRIGEALGLRHEDVDARRRLVAVRPRENVNHRRRPHGGCAHQIGSVTAAHLPRHAALVICVVAVSTASWVFLLSALPNVAPQWSGLVYGAFFAIPLLAVCRGEPDTFRRPDGWPLRLAQATAAALLAVLPLAAALAACGPPPPQPEHGSCDDSVSPSDRVPEAMRGHGIDRGVGRGDVWFVDPGLPRWRDRLEPRGNGFWGKYPLWVGGSRLPQVTVRGIEGTAGDGTADLTPAGDAPPGPVPMGVTIPMPGCWRVTATGESGSASIVVNATPVSSPS